MENNFSKRITMARRELKCPPYNAMSLHVNEILPKKVSAQINYAAKKKSTYLRFVLFKIILECGSEKLSLF